MTNYRLTSLILILVLISPLSACGTGGMDTPSGALASPSAEPRPEESEATSIPREPPVTTDTSIPPTPVVALSPPTLLYFWAQW